MYMPNYCYKSQRCGGGWGARGGVWNAKNGRVLGGHPERHLLFGSLLVCRVLVVHVPALRVRAWTLMGSVLLFLVGGVPCVGNQPEGLVGRLRLFGGSFWKTKKVGEKKKKKRPPKKENTSVIR